ncbi:hypothetical protein VTK56DRAFT_3287 [Thermocarpiscus australiensis]
MLAPGGSPNVVSDNNLINGKMNFDCSTVAPGDKTPCTNSAGISKFRFQTGKTHRLRLINSGANGIQHFSIDGHTLTVIEEDFVPVKPYNTTVVKLGFGQRTDVLVTANVGKGRFRLLDAIEPHRMLVSAAAERRRRHLLRQGRHIQDTNEPGPGVFRAPALAPTLTSA